MIDFDPYFERNVGINLQFDLARRAIEGFGGSREAVEKYQSEELERLRGMFSKPGDLGASNGRAFSQDAATKYTEWLKGALPGHLKQIANRLRQNQLILLVTLLETILKDIHREVLRAKPALLNPERQIPLGKLVAQDARQIIEEEIEREVQSLDRKTIEQREEYFDKRLNLDWFDGTWTPLAKRVSDLRNTILHKDPDVAVSEENLKLAQAVSVALPLGLITQAAVLYPEKFNWQRSDLSATRQLLIKKGRLKAPA